MDEALHAAEHKEGSVDEADKISRAHAFFEDCDPNAQGPVYDQYAEMMGY